MSQTLLPSLPLLPPSPSFGWLSPLWLSWRLAVVVDIHGHLLSDMFGASDGRCDGARIPRGNVKTSSVRVDGAAIVQKVAARDRLGVEVGKVARQMYRRDRGDGIATASGEKGGGRAGQGSRRGDGREELLQNHYRHEDDDAHQTQAISDIIAACFFSCHDMLFYTKASRFCPARPSIPSQSARSLLHASTLLLAYLASGLPPSRTHSHNILVEV